MVLDESCHPDRSYKQVMEPAFVIFVFVFYILLEEMVGMLPPRRRWVMYLRLSQDRGWVNCIVLLRPCRITTLNAGIVFELT